MAKAAPLNVQIFSNFWTFWNQCEHSNGIFLCNHEILNFWHNTILLWDTISRGLKIVTGLLMWFFVKKAVNYTVNLANEQKQSAKN